MKTQLNDLTATRMAVTLFLFIAVSFAGCKKESMPGANKVWMQDNSFSPPSISVSINATVTWTNKGAVIHNVVSNSGLFNIGNINPNGTYSYKFTTMGSFPYTCTLHPGMTGTVIVK